MTQASVSSALAAALLAACVHAPPSPADEAASQVVRLDAAWAETVARGDAEGFRALVAEDALFAGGALLRGREGVWAAWKAFFAEGGPTLRWTPEAGGAAGSGDLAWTTGRFRLERRDRDGAPVATEGRYLTVWHRDASGAWRVALDCALRPAKALGPIERGTVRSLVSRDGSLDAALGTWTLAGPSAGRTGAWIAVRVKSGEAWRTLFDGAVEFRPAR